MSRHLRNVILALTVLIAPTLHPGAAQEATGWRISPGDINIRTGDDRRLQALDDLAQELHGAEWSVDNPDLAEIREQDGRMTVHAKHPGTVTVSAVLRGERRFREIRIWSPDHELSPQTSKWNNRAIGREIDDIAAVPTPDGPHSFSLEQAPSGSTYLRAFEDDGIQVWIWLMPETTHAVDLVCGDWLGGAFISANRSDSYTLYTVGKDVRLRWQLTLPGIRKAHAYNLQHTIHLLSQSSDGSMTEVTALDELTGTQKFNIRLPASYEKLTNVQKTATKIKCASKPDSSSIRTIASRLMVNSDGFAYSAFTQDHRTLESANCKPGSAIEAADVKLAFEGRVILWQIHPHGTYRGTIIEESKSSGPLYEAVSVAYPTGAIIPDGLDGVLLSIRRSQNRIGKDVQGSTDEFIYRVDENGEVVYKMPLPRYVGPLQDGMVLGENGSGFVTRGSLLIAFDVRRGKENWRWESHTPGLKVLAALANGGCLVQTPTAVVEVENATNAKEIIKGQAIIDWRGQMFLRHN